MVQSQKDKEFVITIPRKIFNDKVFQKMLSQINYSSIESKSKASQKDIDDFLLYVKKKRGKVVKAIMDRVKDKV